MKEKMYQTLVLGIDQSYQRTGLCVIADGVKKYLGSIELLKCKNNTQRRNILSERIKALLEHAIPRAKEVICIIERIRLYSGGAQVKGKQFVNISYIKSIGALNALIVDTCANYGVEVYSIDTRAWKAQSVGTAKPQSNKYNVPSEKWPTVAWCISNGWQENITITLPDNTKKSKNVFIRKSDGKHCIFDTDAADAAGIAMYYFCGKKELLQSEH